jgi:predicted HD superfamily hydrolase involved in NAD metabolism
LCEKYGIEINAVEEMAPSLLHAKLGAQLAAERYEIEDPEILGAIRWHTTGKPDMSLLEKIIFQADYIEPMRWKAQNLDEIRAMAFHDLDRAVFYTLRDTLNYLSKVPSMIDDMTNKAYLFYRDICAGKEDDI